MKHNRIAALVLAASGFSASTVFGAETNAATGYSILGTWHCVADNREHDATTKTFLADGSEYERFVEFGNSNPVRYSYKYQNSVLTTVIVDTELHAQKVYKPGDNITVDKAGGRGVTQRQRIVWNGPNGMVEMELDRDRGTEQCHRQYRRRRMRQVPKIHEFPSGRSLHLRRPSE